MHHPVGMRVRKRVRDLAAEAQDLLGRQGSAGQPRAQGLALDQLHGDVDVPVGFADLVDRADVRMIELRRQPRLAQQPRARRGIGERRGRQDLERDVAVEPRVTGPVHLAHATRTDKAYDLERTDAGP